MDEFWSGAYADEPYVLKNPIHHDYAEFEQNKLTPIHGNEHSSPSQASYKAQTTADSIVCTKVANEEASIPATELRESYGDDNFVPATQVIEDIDTIKVSRACSNIQTDEAEEDSLGDYTEDALSWGGHEGNLPESDSQEFFRVSPSNADLIDIPKKPHIQPVFKDPLPIHEKGDTQSKTHGLERTPIYEGESEALFDIENPNANEDENSSQQDKSSIIFSEDELICSSQDISSAYNSDNQPINSTQDRSSINYSDGIPIYSTQDKSKINELEENETVHSTQGKSNVDNIYPNHEIIHSTQGKPFIYETDSEGYLYSTQDKSILRKMYPDVEILPQSKVNDRENVSKKAELPINENDQPSTLNDDIDINIFSMSSLSSQEEGVSPTRKNVKRKHSAVDSKNISCESLSSTQNFRKLSKGNNISLETPEDGPNKNYDTTLSGDSNHEVASEVTKKSINNGVEWNSDEEEELDYRYMEEMNEYL